jgi:hypothetical protein
MSRLVYDADRRLRDGERVLADHVDEGRYGYIVVGGEDYEVTHRGRTGWHFRLIDLRGETVCEYEPYPVVRGGRLRGRWTDVSLRGVPLRPRRWTFRGEPGWRMGGEVVRTGGRREVDAGPPPGGAVGVRTVTAFPSWDVVLDGEMPIMSPEVALQLAFGCWILVERASIAPAGGGGG